MKTKNLSVGVLAAVLTLALWWTFLLKPTRTQASKVRAESASERSKLGPLQAQLDQANADEAHANTFKSQLASLQLAMPNTPALAAFIREANGIAVASGVSWQSVTHGPPTTGADGVSSITAGIQIKGTYPQVIDYVTQLAALPRLLVVDTVQFTTSGTTGAGAGSATSSAGASTGPFSGASELSVTISARMFAKPDVSAAATGAPNASAAGPAAAGAGAGAGTGAPVVKPETLNNS